MYNNSRSPAFFSRVNGQEAQHYYSHLQTQLQPRPLPRVVPQSRKSTISNLFIGQVRVDDTEETLTKLLNGLAQKECVGTIEIMRRQGSGKVCAFAYINNEESLTLLLSLNKSISHVVLDSRNNGKLMYYVFERKERTAAVSQDPQRIAGTQHSVFQPASSSNNRTIPSNETQEHFNCSSSTTPS